MCKLIVTLVGFVLLAEAVAEAPPEFREGRRPVARDRSLTPADMNFRNARVLYIDKYRPLWLEAQAAWWEANTTGSDAAFARKKAADKILIELHSDRRMFVRLKALKESGQMSDPVLLRELEVMYRSFMSGQADPDLRKKIVDLENEVEQTFNTHRSKVGEQELTENGVREILANTTDSAKAEQAWKAYMAVGLKVEGKLRQLVQYRNQVARQLGFDDFYSMSLSLQEIDETEFFKLFDELDRLTRAPFARIKRDIDARLASRFNLSISKLRPWHYGDLFFQEAPRVDEINLDDLFKGVDLIDLTKRYYAGIGLPCEDIIARSDLYEKPGKSPHAFCADLNRKGDIRVLCNLKPNLYWADTLMHEMGHAVYDKHIRSNLPFLLREPSHSITTEGMAMMFGALVKHKDWLVNVLKLDPRNAARIARSAGATLRAEKILFSRWTQVMVRFEHGMYTKPDQDPGKLWWDLKKKYQLLNPPDSLDRPDYAAKVHILTAPVYYHSYLMGDLFAAQVHHFIAHDVLGLKDASETSLYGKPKAGDFLRTKIFGPGNLYSWNELTRLATGEPLTAKYFAKRFVD